MKVVHKSVLLQEVIDGLNIQKGDIFVDGTLGNGGHLEEVVKRFGNTAVMIGIDQDHDAISRATARLEAYKCPIHYVEGNFRDIQTILKSLNFEKVDKILFDIGLSSNQFEESGRGFSFQKDEPLLMTFRKDLKEGDLTAKEILNNWELENINTILSSYGEEQFAWKIANAIVERRKIKPIETTFELVEIVKSATPNFYHHRKIHPATKTFQALRITVNDEIESLKDGIKNGFELLNYGGRLAVISFHSLEDRVVKKFFSAKGGSASGGKEGIIITKKPIVPTDEEVKENPRSRSAKLRIIEKQI